MAKAKRAAELLLPCHQVAHKQPTQLKCKYDCSEALKRSLRSNVKAAAAVPMAGEDTAKSALRLAVATRPVAMRHTTEVSDAQDDEAQDAEVKETAGDRSSAVNSPRICTTVPPDQAALAGAATDTTGAATNGDDVKEIHDTGANMKSSPTIEGKYFGVNRGVVASGDVHCEVWQRRRHVAGHGRCRQPRRRDAAAPNRG